MSGGMSQGERWVWIGLLSLGFLAGSGNPIAAEERSKSAPLNIVVVLCDDLGYGDVGCYGHDLIQTPNIDRFAAEGLKLTDCYAAAANCSPARTGLLTGRTPYRVGVYNAIPFLSPMHARAEEVTIAHLLQAAGYATCVVGKWHLNGWFNLPGQPQPSDMGFEHWFATQNNCLPNHRNPYNFVRNGIPVGPQQGYASHLVTDEAIRWLTGIRDPEKPFFLYVAYHEPHEPIATDAKYKEPYNPAKHPSLAAHHGNITQMDAAFGRLLNTLDELQLRENTFVMFTSDNGPALTNWHPHGSAGPFRSKKGTLWEGGIRVPGLVQWPGVTQPGTVSSEPVSGVDLLPTLCALTNIEPPQDRVLDGTNVLPAFRGESVTRAKPLYWQYNYRRDWPQVALREGDWKLLASLDPHDQPTLIDITAEQMHFLKTCTLGEFQLYHLKEDIAEAHDLSQSEPERLSRMVKQMRELFTEVQQESPVWPEWKHLRYEAQRIEWPSYPRPERQKNAR